MKKIFKCLLCTFIIFSLLTTSNFTIFAAEKNKYAEEKKQIYFDNINIAVNNNNELIFTISSESSLFERIRAASEIDELNNFFDKYTETEKAIATKISNDELYALSFIEAPLKLENGHYERLTAADNTYVSSDATPSTRYYFSLATSIIRTGTQNSNGEYTYYGLTCGEWSENSFLGGKKYPATGYDSIVQAIDTELTIHDSDLMVNYVNNSGEYTEGISGTNFYPDDGGSSFIQYKVQDDPIGLLQMSSFILTTECFGQARNTSRAICSSYTHTWLSMSIDVSLEIGAEIAIDDEFNHELSAGIVLSIDPSVKLACWNLFNSTSFAF